MHKFNVGDRVVYICKNPDSHDRQYKLYAGMTGTVIKAGFDTGCTGIAFDNYTFGNGQYHNKVYVNNTDITFYTPNFKVGDRVELLCEPRDNLIRNGLKVGFTGTVKKILNDNYVTVTWDNWHSGWSDKHGTEFFNGSCYNVATNIIKLNRPKFKFNVGDTVKSNDNFSKDLIGKIINISKFLDRIVYLVEFNETSDNFHDGNVELNELIKGSKTGKDNHCYYLHENNIEKWNGKCNKMESMIIA